MLRVLTKEEIQKLADRTREIRGKLNPLTLSLCTHTDLICVDKRHEEESRAERKASRRRERNKDRRDRDEYEDDSENEFAPKKPMMLEAPSAGTSTLGGAPSSEADFIRDNRDRRDREREREPQYMSGGRGERDRGYGSDAYGS